MFVKMNGDLGDASKDDKKVLGNRLTRTELVLGLTLTSVIVYLLYSRAIHADAEAQPLSASDCANPACYESIIEVKDYTDPSVDPCLDFQGFVCGGFFGTAYRKQITCQLIQEEMELQNELNTIIVEPISSEYPQVNKILNLFFRACMDVDEIDANYDQRILDMIIEIGGWPLVEGQSWDDKNFDWTKMMVKCKQLGLPFQWFLEFDLHFEDVNYLKISFPTVSDQADNVRMSSMEKILSSLLGKKMNVKDIFAFDQRLVKIIKSQNPEPVLISISDLQKLHPLFNWLELINNITGDNFELFEESEIVSNVQEYIVKLYQLLKGTPERTQANYIIWKIVEHFAPYMSQRVRKHVDKERRSDLCKAKARESFPYFTEIIYISKYSKEEIRESVMELTKGIRQEFLNRVEDSSWWNTTAGQIYWEKFDNTDIDIGVDFGIPENTPPEEFFEDNYWHLGNLRFDSDNYWHLGNFNFRSDNPNIIEIITKRSQCYYDSLFSKINETGVDPEEKSIVLKAMTMNVFFQESLNKMVVPPSALHGILYDHERPQYLNFASLGTFLAREFIRSLQTFTGHDKNATNAAFEASNRCLEDDYLKLTSDNSTLYFVQEIIPDIVARDIAYTAYQNWVTTNGEETPLPLLSYTPNQLFWIKSSLINCHKKMTDIEDNNFEVMVSKYKNILSVRHSRQFADDFGCSEKTPMNPSKKC